MISHKKILVFFFNPSASYRQINKEGNSTLLMDVVFPPKCDIKTVHRGVIVIPPHVTRRSFVENKMLAMVVPAELLR